MESNQVYKCEDQTIVSQAMRENFLILLDRLPSEMIDASEELKDRMWHEIRAEMNHMLSVYQSISIDGLVQAGRNVLEGKANDTQE